MDTVALICSAASLYPCAFKLFSKDFMVGHLAPSECPNPSQILHYDSVRLLIPSSNVINAVLISSSSVYKVVSSKYFLKFLKIIFYFFN